ncbi:hypothetical protein DY000_02030502 [Brassica cretica]|uniref:Uncharacterized protein n=1 Tax=Brassica cretica TaxID=69181 RepID=A0ABQ7DET6_BRACR|nr:hypothetical protein DY000_02030502 [Brassica cretica]
MKMKKNKPKNSPPSKTSPKSNLTRPSSPHVKIIEKVPFFLADNEVSDAQFDSPVDAVAQLPVSHSDTNSQSEVSPPGTIVIAEQSADPALACNEDLFSQHESSSKGLPPSPSATLPGDALGDFPTVTQTASHRRPIRRRLLVESSAPSPSPPREMKKKKPKKSSPSKTSPKTSPAKSSFPPTKVPEKVPIFVVDNEVSDAQFDSTVEAVAQLPVSHPDPTSQSEVSPSAKSVIAVQSADPSSALDEELTNNRPESSSKGLPPSCSATLPEASKPSKGLDLSGATTNVAIADANDNHERQESKGKKTRRGRSKDKLNWVLVNPPNDAHVPSKEHPAEQSSPVVPPQPNQTVTPMLEFPHQTKLGTAKDIVRGGRPVPLRAIFFLQSTEATLQIQA